VLVHESADQLLAEPDTVRFLHVVILNALRDKATQLEVRFGVDGGLLYYRIDGRDWELTPPSDEIYPHLKDAVRSAARLVQPERPELTVIAGVPGARYEPLEIGWLTYQLAGRWIDLAVHIDPREPFGFIRFDIDGADEFAEPAGDALAEYATRLATEQ
jgi:hypothetical protein